MPGPCRIDSVQLLCGSDIYNHGIFYNAEVLCCPTTVPELVATFADNYAGNTPVVALAANPLTLDWVNNTWHGLPFNNPYDYDGAANLIIEYRWSGDDGNSVYDRGFYTTGNRACNANSATAPTGTPRNYMPRCRIFYSTTGIADPASRHSSFELRPSLSAVPNPTRGRVRVSVPPFSVHHSSFITLSDPSGRLVLTRTLDPSTPRTLSFDLAPLPRGVYVLRCGPQSLRVVRD